MLQEIDDGRLHEQLTELWPSVVKKVIETNKPATLTLTLSVSSDGGRMVIVAPKVTTKMPTKTASAALFYTDEDGATYRNDPKQMPLKNVTPIKSGGN